MRPGIDAATWALLTQRHLYFPGVAGNHLSVANPAAVAHPGSPACAYVLSYLDGSYETGTSTANPLLLGDTDPDLAGRRVVRVTLFDPTDDSEVGRFEASETDLGDTSYVDGAGHTWSIVTSGTDKLRLADAVRRASEFDVHWKVQVANADDTLIDLSDRIGGISGTLPSPDAPIATLNLQFLRELNDDPATSLAPLIASDLNLDDTAAYARLLQVGRRVVASVAFTAPGGARPSTNWYEVFRGRSQRVGWAGRYGGAVVDASDQGRDLQRTKSEAEYTYSDGTAIETAAQAALTNNGFGTTTLAVPVATGDVLDVDYAPGMQKPVWQQVQDLAGSIGYACWYRYQADGAAHLTLFEPDRTKTGSDLTFAHITEVERFEETDEALGPILYGEYSDSNGARQLVGPVEDTDAIAKYGGVRASFWVSEEEDSPVRTEAAMTTLLTRILPDVADPDVVASYRTAFFPFGEVSVDRYTFVADDLHYDTDQELAPFAIRFDHQSGQLASCAIDVTGHVSGGSGRWRARRASVTPTTQLLECQAKITSSTATTVTVQVSALNEVDAQVELVAISGTATKTSGAAIGTKVASGSSWTFTRPVLNAGTSQALFRATLSGFASDEDLATIEEQGRDTVPLLMRAQVTSTSATTQTVRVAVADPFPGGSISVSYSSTGVGGVSPASPQTIASGSVTSSISTTGFVDFTVTRGTQRSGTGRVTFTATRSGRTSDSDAVDVPAADPDALGTQNLLDKTAANTTAWTGALGAATTVALADLKLAVGDVISLSGEMLATGVGQNLFLRLEALNSGGTVLGTFDASGRATSTTTWTRIGIAGVTIPASTVSLRYRGVDGNSFGGSVRRWMLARGIVALPYEDPPIRGARETQDDLDDGSTYRRTTHDEADQATKPSQNLWNARAATERTWSSTSEAADTYSQVALSDTPLAVGEIVSASAEVKQTSASETPRFRLAFLNSGGTTISSADGAIVGTTTYTRGTVANQTIPAGTTTIRLYGVDGQSIGGAIRKRMLNRGPVALAYEAPPLRSGRETQDDLGDGSTYKRTTADEKSGAGRAFSTISSTRGVYVPDTESVYIGDQGDPSFLAKTIVIPAAMMVPQTNAGTWFVGKDYARANLATGHAWLVGGVVLPVGAEITNVSAELFRDLADGAFATVYFYRVSGITPTQLTILSASTDGWSLVSGSLSEEIAAGYTYAWEIDLFPGGTNASDARIAWLQIDYRIAKLTTGV